MSTMHEAVASVNGEQLLEQVREIVDYVEQSCQAGRAAHEVEKALWDRVLALGRQALGMFFRLGGNGDEGQWVTLADGQPLRRLEALHPGTTHPCLGVSGLSGWSTEPARLTKIAQVPLDARLQLPKGVFSYLLQDWKQSLAQQMPFAQG